MVAGLGVTIAFSTDCADAVVDNPLTEDVQVSVYVNVNDELTGALGSVKVALPLVAFAPGHVSPRRRRSLNSSWRWLKSISMSTIGPP